MKFTFPDRLLPYFSIMGLCITMFVSGVIVSYYKVPPSQFISDGLDAATAWTTALSQNNEEPIDIDENVDEFNEDIITRPTIEIWNKKAAYNGYTLVSTAFMDAAWLVDMEGKIVHRWDMPFAAAWPNAKHVHRATNSETFINAATVLPNGDLIAQYSALGDTPYGYGILKMDKDSKILWTYTENAHHDFYIDKKNGEIYALIHKIAKTPVKGLESLNYPMLMDYIVRLSPEGKELDRLSMLDAFRDSPFEHLLYHPANGGLAKWDHFHTNSIEKLEPSMASKFPMFKAGQLLVSLRSFNVIAVIDPKTRKAIWAYDGGWRMQHAVHFVDDDNILVFDNTGHVEKQGNYSRLLEFDPKTLGVKWHYMNKQTPFYSSIIGRAQRLPNGNTLIAESMKAHIFEITPEGKTVWSYKLQKAKRRDDTLNAIVTSVRYKESDLPFLQKNVK
jgi:hypothetical protein